MVHVDETTGMPTLVGVVSWGQGCAQAGYPGVYTKVSSLVGWVNQQMGSQKPPPPSSSTPLPPAPPPPTAGGGIPAGGVLVLNGAGDQGDPSLGCLMPEVDDGTTAWPNDVTPHSRIAAQCCAADGGCRRKVNNKCVADQSVGGVIKAFTYAETDAFCKSHGLEMCKQSCAGQGCQYNDHPVFTSMACLPSPSPPPSSGVICEDTCDWNNDAYCDDGGPGSEYDWCDFGSDCTDCGPRGPSPSPSPPRPPSTPRPPSPPPSDIIDKCVTGLAGKSPFSAPMLNTLDAGTQIVGGVPVDPPRSLQYQVSLGAYHFCGGTLISPTWVLTAAHCGTASVIKAGVHAMPPSESDECVQTRNVINYIPHPDYDDWTLDYDIALMELDAPVDYASIPMNTDSSVEVADTPMTVSGWGATSEGGSGSPVLHKVGVPVVSDSSCQNSYNGGITNRMICAGFPEGEKDSCQGDSGGPMVHVDETTGMPTLVGVVSWGQGCAQAGYPGVYTKVSSLVGWVNQEMAGRRRQRALFDGERGNHTRADAPAHAAAHVAVAEGFRREGGADAKVHKRADHHREGRSLLFR